MAVLLKWEHSADLVGGPGGYDPTDTSTANLLVNGTLVGAFATPQAQLGREAVVADITAVFNPVASDIEWAYTAGDDTYHLRGARIAIDGGPDNYLSFPDGFPYTYEAAWGTDPSQDTGDPFWFEQEGYDGLTGSSQWSMQTEAWVAIGSFHLYYPGVEAEAVVAAGWSLAGVSW